MPLPVVVRALQVDLYLPSFDSDAASLHSLEEGFGVESGIGGLREEELDVFELVPPPVDPAGNRNEVFAGGFIYYPDNPKRVWSMDKIGKAVFYYQRELNERFMSVVT